MGIICYVLEGALERQRQYRHRLRDTAWRRAGDVGRRWYPAQRVQSLQAGAGALSPDLGGAGPRRYFAALLNAGEAVTRAFAPDRRGWVQVIRGAGEVSGRSMRAGDGVTLEGEATLTLTSRAAAPEFLAFDLP
jgi:hypothetical protein